MAKPVKDDPLAQMRKRYEVAVSACSDKYDKCIDDIRFTFVPGEQWDADMKAKRAGRPMYEFNKTRPVVKSVTNDMRQNSPAVKIRAAEDGHKELADIMQGLIRNIEAQSRADTAYDPVSRLRVSGFPGRRIPALSSGPQFLAPFLALAPPNYPAFLRHPSRPVSGSGHLG